MIKVDDIHKAHNNVFIKTFSDPENVKVLLKMALPEPIKNAVDYSPGLLSWQGSLECSPVICRPIQRE